ncbi:MAG: epoxide hydrolase family protein [Thermaurantiacus sp.]
MNATSFTIPVNETECEWIRSRVEYFRFFEEPDGHQWEHGANRGFMERLRARWLDGYDWAASVARMNRLPHFCVEVEPGFRLHCVHLRSSRANAIPLLVAHGWPGSIREFDALYEELAEPGDPAAPAFHVVAPSLPGYAWSDKPKAPVGPRAVGRLYATLMDRLGYGGFLYQGGDWGSVVGGWMGLDCPALIGLHLNGYGLRSADMRATTDAEREWLAWARMIRLTETGYLMLQGTKPQSLGFAMMDSPMGVAAWFAEKYCGWSDTKGAAVAPPFPLDTLLDTIMIYLTTRTFLTATWLYRGMFLEGGFTIPDGRRIEVPTAVARFPRDLLAFPPRTMVERGYDVVRWTEFETGGHFAGLETPDLLLQDLRSFAATL